MKVVVRVTRRTEYATIVEMTREKLDDLNMRLESTDRAVRKVAEREANNLIDTRDWQDDELFCVESVERMKR